MCLPLSVQQYFTTYVGILWRVTLPRIQGICNCRYLCIFHAFYLYKKVYLSCILFISVLEMCVFSSSLSFFKELLIVVSTHSYFRFLIRCADVDFFFWGELHFSPTNYHLFSFYTLNYQKFQYNPYLCIIFNFYHQFRSDR